MGASPGATVAPGQVWGDLRLPTRQRWLERFTAIHREVESIPPGDTSSRYLRTERFWDEAKVIQPGKIVV